MDEQVEPFDMSVLSANASAQLGSALVDLLVVLQRRLDEHHVARAELGQEERTQRYY
jgi:hypothetical protein